MKKESAFFFEPENNTESPGCYGIYMKGVNCFKGKEHPIGHIYVPDNLNKFKDSVKISIVEVDLNAGEYIELFKEIKEQLHVENYTDVKFTA